MELPGEKLIIKLWESIADKGIGSLLKPWQIRREGRATLDIRRQELIALAEAEVAVAAIRAAGCISSATEAEFENAVETGLVLTNTEKPLRGPLLRLPQVAAENIQQDSLRREIVLAKSVIYAEQELFQDSEEPTEAEISDDWLLRWRECASNTSSDKLQRLWGKILAGEIRSPGQFSLRTLEFIKNVSQDEATLITGLTSFVINQRYIFRGGSMTLDLEGLTFDVLLFLQEIGILLGVDQVGLNATIESARNDFFENFLVSSDKVIRVRHPDKRRSVSLKVFKLTTIGHQIVRLGKYKTHKLYVDALAQAIKLQGFEVSVGTGEVVGDSIFYEGMRFFK